MKFFSTIATLIAAASAYQVLTPTLNSTITKGTDVQVTWSSVDTDPTTFSIYLVNFQTAHWPPTVLSLAQNVQGSAGSTTVRIPCSVTSDYGWQLNFINGTNTYVIYAQSPKFFLTGECVDPATPATYQNSTTSAVTTVIYNNPVVWFVQPANVIAAAAICPPAAQQTVTVIAGAGVAPAQTVTKTVTVAGAPAAVVTPVCIGSSTSKPASAAVSVVATPIANALPAVTSVSANGASIVGVSGSLAAIAAAFVMLL